MKRLSYTRTTRFAVVLATMLVFGLSTGCATFSNGATQRIPVYSTPLGATVSVAGFAPQVTPCQFNLPRNRDFTMHISKSGYLDVTYPLTRTQTGAIAGNVWIGGLVGLAVDAATGANYKFVPESVHVTLPPSDYSTTFARSSP